MKRPAYMAGHSLGEYTALVAAGSLTFQDALRLVRERGRLMQEAGARNAGTMAAVVGLTRDSVIEICRVSGAEACNFNARTQVVVGGTRDAVERACTLAKEQGGRGLPMNVAGAFHTSLMEPATVEFQEILDGESIEDPVLPVIGNVAATSMLSAAACRSDLQRANVQSRSLASIDSLHARRGCHHVCRAGARPGADNDVEARCSGTRAGLTRRCGHHGEHHQCLTLATALRW